MSADFLSFEIGDKGKSFELLVNGRSLTAHMVERKRLSVAPVSPLPPALHLCRHLWRILYEGFPLAGTSPTASWLRAHSTASLHGYPEFHFGQRQGAWVIATFPRVSKGIVYVAAGEEHITLAYAMKRLDAFFQQLEDEELLRLYKEWLAEYADEQIRIRRICEAKLGYDPGMAPKEIIEHVLAEFPVKENRELLLSGRFDMPERLVATQIS